MGWFDWLFGKKYDPSSALTYVKTNSKYLNPKLIPFDKRKLFQELFLKLAKAEISELGRNLKEKEINTLVNVLRIRLQNPQEKTNLGPLIIELNRINQELITNLYKTEQTLSYTKEPQKISSTIGSLLKNLIQMRTQLTNLKNTGSKIQSKQFSKSIDLEIKLITELISNIYPKKDQPIPRTQIMSQLNKSRKAIIELNDALIAQLAEIQEAA